MIKNVTYQIVVLLLTSACIQEVDLDLYELEPILVVEGKVTNGPGPYRVRVSMSEGFDSPSTGTPVSDAEVKISELNGLEENLRLVEPGVYETLDLQGVVGRTYVLEVLHEGQVYSASSYLGPVGKIDSLVAIFEEETTLRNEGYYVSMYAQKSIPDQVNYYTGTIYKNDSALNGRDLFFVTSDEFVTSLRALEFGLAFQLGDTVVWELESLTKEEYDYYIQLSIILNNDHLVTPVRYVNPPTNFNPTILGVFQTSAIESDTLIIR